MHMRVLIQRKQFLLCKAGMDALGRLPIFVDGFFLLVRQVVTWSDLFVDIGIL